MSETTDDNANDLMLLRQSYVISLIEQNTVLHAENQELRAEIERLRAEVADLQVVLRGRTAEFQAEIERLRAAGDALAHLMPHAHLSVPCRPPRGRSLDEWCSECAALNAWQEARRG